MALRGTGKHILKIPEVVAEPTASVMPEYLLFVNNGLLFSNKARRTLCQEDDRGFQAVTRPPPESRPSHLFLAARTVPEARAPKLYAPKRCALSTSLSGKRKCANRLAFRVVAISSHIRRTARLLHHGTVQAQNVLNLGHEPQELSLHEPQELSLSARQQDMRRAAAGNLPSGAG
jgi:hypothetical protein